MTYHKISDSPSELQVAPPTSRIDIVFETMSLINKINKENGDIECLWVPLHIRMKGNE